MEIGRRVAEGGTVTAAAGCPRKEKKREEGTTKNGQEAKMNAVISLRYGGSDDISTENMFQQSGRTILCLHCEAFRGSFDSSTYEIRCIFRISQHLQRIILLGS